jgi:menaquinone-dependent protoporphyrinogen oxidase
MGFRPGDPVPARVLVAYATKLGSNAEIAEAIAAELRVGGFQAAAHPVRAVASLDGWAAVVLGSAIYAAHWQRDARRFVLRFRDGLAARPLWLWSSGPLDERLAQAGLPISAHAAEITQGLGAFDHRTFGGRLAEDAPIDPQVLQTHPIGDFRDWDAIRGYAAGIRAALSTMSLREAQGSDGTSSG